MNVLIVLAGDVDVDIKTVVNKYNINYVVAVDGGYDEMIEQSVTPNIVIGDFDSLKSENMYLKSIILPTQKDNTDFEEALKYLDEKIENLSDIYVIGFVGSNRLEHFYNNINLLRPKMYFLSKNQKIYLLNPGVHKIEVENTVKWKYISFFAYDNITKLTLKGFKYPLKNKDLKIHDTLCISNELEIREGIVTFKTGKLLVFLSTN